MINLNELTTEKDNKKTLNLSKMSTEDILRIMNEEDKTVAYAVEKVIPEIEALVLKVINAFEVGGRLIYIGAGSSGRIGVMDAVECPPTFGTSFGQVIGLMAGGEKAFVKAVEGAEDKGELGKEDLLSIQLEKRDVVVGLAASGRTPYVIGALEYAKSLGCATGAIVCNQSSEVGKCADIAIEVITGPEILTGSTRLKAGTAQKMIANMITTTAMVGIGKVFKNLMVDVQQTNQKLQVRAENIVIQAVGVEREIAKAKLSEAKGSVKLAIAMLLLNLDVEEAKLRLQRANGHIEKIIE